MKAIHLAAAVGLAAMAGVSSAQTNQASETGDRSYLQSRSQAVAKSQFGMAAPRGEINRVIDVTTNMPWLNVTQDETVRIRNGGRSFDWQFSTWTTSSFDLAQIAPPDFGASPTLRVYVAPNPLYKGS